MWIRIPLSSQIRSEIVYCGSFVYIYRLLSMITRCLNMLPVPPHVSCYAKIITQFSQDLADRAHPRLLVLHYHHTH